MHFCMPEDPMGSHLLPGGRSAVLFPDTMNEFGEPVTVPSGSPTTYLARAEVLSQECQGKKEGSTTSNTETGEKGL
jgi:hypothetical protein